MTPIVNAETGMVKQASRRLYRSGLRVFNYIHLDNKRPHIPRPPVVSGGNTPRTRTQPSQLIDCVCYLLNAPHRPQLSRPTE